MTLISEIAGRALRVPAPATRDVEVERDLDVRMSDGAVLLADRYFPRGVERPPTVLVRSPYGRRGAYGLLYGRLFAERGFQVVVQSVRGTFSSGGQLDPFDEREDGLATVDWLRRQPWYGGAYATTGPSYLGITQWAIASEAGGELAAVAASVTASEFRSYTYGGGAFTLDSALSWASLIHRQERWLGPLRQLYAVRRTLPAAFGHLPLREADALAFGEQKAFYQEWLEHTEPGDPYWERRDFSRTVGAVEAPVSLVSGWYDIFLPWTLRDHRALRDAGRPTQLTIGPWAHISPGLLRATAREALVWLRAHMHGDTRLLSDAPVRFFVTGAREWREAEDWPPPGLAPQRWHLHAGGRLDQAPSAPSEPDSYRYEPRFPTPAVAGPRLTAPSLPTDNAELEARPDVLTYTSARLADDLEAIGPVTAALHVRSSLEHADFFARLCDVDPAGRSVNVCDALMRVSPGRPEADPDGSLALAIELWPIAHRFRRGHRLRLQVSSGAHPRYARNQGSGEPLATATTLVAADQEVLHDPDHPSAIVLPVAG